MLNEGARRLERAIDRQQKELQRSAGRAGRMQRLQTDLQSTFQGKLYQSSSRSWPRRASKCSTQRDSGIVFANPALDLTADIEIKRFDAAQAAAPPAAAPGNAPGHASGDAPGDAPRQPRNRFTGSQGSRFSSFVD